MVDHEIPAGASLPSGTHERCGAVKIEPIGDHRWTCDLLKGHDGPYHSARWYTADGTGTNSWPASPPSPTTPAPRCGLTGKPGPTGRFPLGKIVPEDEGELAVAFTHKDGKVVIDFGKPVAWIGFTPEQAEQIADTLREHAAAARPEAAAVDPVSAANEFVVYPPAVEALTERPPTPVTGETGFTEEDFWQIDQAILDAEALPRPGNQIERLMAIADKIRRATRGAGAAPASILAGIPFKPADGETVQYAPATALPDIAYRAPTPKEQQELDAIRRYGELP